MILSLAERVRFELTIRLPRCRISSAVPSATQPPLQFNCYNIFSDKFQLAGRRLILCNAGIFKLKNRVGMDIVSITGFVIINLMDFCSDEQLAMAGANGDDKSFEILVARYLHSIYNFAFRYVGDSSQAQDISQEVFLRAWRNLKKFDSEKKFKTWLFAIAKNACIDYLRQRKVLPFSFFEDEAGNNYVEEGIISEDIPLEVFEKNDLVIRLNKAISELPPRQQEVLSLHYWEKMTFEEISQALHEPLDTLKSRCRRAVISLRAKLK